MNQDQIVQKVLNFIAADGATDGAFNRLALDLFKFHFELNEPFRRFALKRGRTPRTVKTWKEIPAVPIDAFKELTLSCCPPEEVTRVFMTSGTTKDGIRGKSFHSTLSVYNASMLQTFEKWVMQGLQKINMGILYPSEDVMPNSSLSHYLALAFEHFGSSSSLYLMDERNGINFDMLFEEFERAQTTGVPFALLGASYSFVPVLDEMARRNIFFVLPAGSRLFDTGGFKGLSRNIEPDEFYGSLSLRLGVPRRLCINMYGMTELSTQFYDWGNDVCPSVKRGPHWIRTRALNPLTGEDMPRGEVGILAHCDLAHFNIVSSILTEDAGIARDDGFVFLGRTDGVEAKGCSMAVEEFLTATRI